MADDAGRSPIQTPKWKLAKSLRVVRLPGGPAVLYIDGVPFPYYTKDGFTIHSARKETPSVTLTIVAESVELADHFVHREAPASPAEAVPDGR